jgi:hypothetical protein
VHPDTCTHPAGQSAYTVAHVIERFHKSFFSRYGDSLNFEQRKALQAILQCRTESMGGHKCYCAQCREYHFFYHSCNHRNCPICGAQDTAGWVDKRLAQALPLPHYMITVTLPAQLRPACQFSPEKIYPLFFKCAARAIKDILANPKHLGIQSGFFGVLQTWQQTLTLHPHIHFIVPAGGLDPEGNLKIAKKQWLVWGDVFAKRLKHLLLTEFKSQAVVDQNTLNACWKISWNADVENFGNGHNAIKYLGRYIYKSAISNARIKTINQTHVTFTLKDRQNGKTKDIRITGEAFLMRYFTHVLPSKFHRVRYYGFMHPRAKATFAIIQALLDAEPPKQTIDKPEPASAPFKCPKCGNAMNIIEHRPRAPPDKRVIAWIWNHTQKAA